MSNSSTATIEMTLSVFPRIARYPVDFALPETQIRMVRNKPKYHAFSKVMAQCVPGKRVLEIGTGSGVLALLAVAHGAANVVAVDRETVTPMTRTVFKDYRQSKQVEVLEGDVFDLDASLGEFDVIISETIGYLGFEENIAPILSYARKRFGTARTIVIPGDMAVMLEPIHVEFKLPHQAPHLDLNHRRSHSFERLRAPQPVKLGDEFKSVLEISEVWRATREAEVHALAVYFDSVLFAETRLTNRENPNWPHCMIPLETPMRVGTGEMVDCRLKLAASAHETYEAATLVKDATGLRRAASSFDTPEICIKMLPHAANTVDALRKEVEETLRSLNLFDLLA